MNTTDTLKLLPDHVCIGVADIDAAIAWYERVLGFSVDIRWTVPELPGFRLAYIKKDDFRIELIDTGEREAEPVQPMAFDEFLRIPGFSHLCFRVDDVDVAMDAVLAHGVAAELAPTDFPDVGRRVAFFRDNNGNFIELAGPMKGGDTDADKNA